MEAYGSALFDHSLIENDSLCFLLALLTVIDVRHIRAPYPFSQNTQPLAWEALVKCQSLDVIA